MVTELLPAAGVLLCLCHPTVSVKVLCFSGCLSVASLCLFGQILLPQYLLNALNNFDKTDREYLLVPTDILVRFCRSKVKVTAGD